jgi:hypothetical protein
VDFPLPHGSKVDGLSLDTANSAGLAVTGSASAHTKGSYVQLIASTAEEYSGLMLTFGSSSICTGLLDIAIGSAGSEQDIVPNIMFQTGVIGGLAGSATFLPLRIPAGSRIAARLQTVAGGSQVVRFCLLGFTGGYSSRPPLGRATTYGVNTGTSRGTSIDPGASANTKGSFAQIVASTANNIRALMICLGSQGNPAPTSTNWLIDIGIGPATEKVLVANLFMNSHLASGLFMPSHYFLPVSIRAGTRVAARAQCGSTDPTDRLFDISLIGFD